MALKEEDISGNMTAALPDCQFEQPPSNIKQEHSYYEENWNTDYSWTKLMDASDKNAQEADPELNSQQNMELIHSMQMVHCKQENYYTDNTSPDMAAKCCKERDSLSVSPYWSNNQNADSNMNGDENVSGAGGWYPRENAYLGASQWEGSYRSQCYAHPPPTYATQPQWANAGGYYGEVARGYGGGEYYPQYWPR
jgi:hypothetical protein